MAKTLNYFHFHTHRMFFNMHNPKGLPKWKMKVFSIFTCGITLGMLLLLLLSKGLSISKFCRFLHNSIRRKLAEEGVKLPSFGKLEKNWHLTVPGFSSEDKKHHSEHAIPQKFASNVGAKLKAPVSLTGPSGARWNVGLTTIGDTLFLKDGWKEFVDAHSLEEGDLLIFKYNGASKFDVSVFDKHSSCEKEASCFVKKCEHADVASGSMTKRPIPVASGKGAKMPIPECTDSINESSSHEEYESTDSTSESSSHEEYESTDSTSESSSHEEYESTDSTCESSSHEEYESTDSTSESSSHEEYDATATNKSKLASTPTARAWGTRANANLRSREIKIIK